MCAMLGRVLESNFCSTRHSCIGTLACHGHPHGENLITVNHCTLAPGAGGRRCYLRERLEVVTLKFWPQFHLQVDGMIKT